MMISPTGKGLRQPDDFGEGHYGAPRSGGRKHEGVDFACIPGQDIIAPATLDIVRISKPYADSHYSGLLMHHPYFDVFLWYFEPIKSLVGSRVLQGEVIGKAQDISERYNTDERHMNPHIHLGIPCIDPMWFMILTY